MLLTLEVVSANGRELGPARRKTFDAGGGRIGRAPECEWVIANPYVSRHHATIRCISGTFYVESVGDNGVAINAPESLLASAQRHALRNGDRIFVDEYEISVNVSGAEAAAGLGAGIPMEDPFFTPAAAPSASPTIPPQWQPLESPLAGDELDPLRQLSGSRTGETMKTRALPEQAWNHTPSLSDNFIPPAPPSAAASGNAIPEDWDMTSFGRTKTQATPSGLPPLREPTNVQPRRPAPAPRPQAEPTPATIPGQRNVSPPGPATAPPPRRPAVPPAAEAAATTGSAVNLDEMLRNAGVDPQSVPPETIGALGEILRLVVNGTVEVLRARGDIKTEFRLPVTRLKVSENNPLKFAANAEDAMTSLLGRRNPAYLPPVEAFKDAFEDIRLHQMAMLSGMRAGFDNVLDRLDPARLEEEFEKQGKRGGLLGLSSKSKYWELYEEYFQKMAADRGEAFRRLFGEDFAQAYEQQLDALKRSRKKT